MSNKALLQFKAQLLQREVSHVLDLCYGEDVREIAGHVAAPDRSRVRDWAWKASRLMDEFATQLGATDD